MDFIRQLLHESLAILHTYLRPQVLSTEETPEYIQKLKQTVRPLASIAAMKRHSQQKISPLADISERACETKDERVFLAFRRSGQFSIDLSELFEDQRKMECQSRDRTVDFRSRGASSSHGNPNHNEQHQYES